MGSEGRFPKSIGNEVRGGDLKAEGTVAADPFFDEWQEREDARNVEYFEIDGQVDDLTDKVIERDLRRKGFAD